MNPIEKFQTLYQEALDKSGRNKVNAMALSSVDDQGKPHNRIVLFRGIIDGGFSFYTNLESDKGRQLLNNPHVALVFYWEELDRQIRIEGKAIELEREQVLKYWDSRPRKSRISGTISEQSQPIESYQALKDKFHQKDQELEGQEIDCPDFWGGFKIVPDKIEFWKGSGMRLHERVLFKREGQTWRQSILQP